MNSSCSSDWSQLPGLFALGALSFIVFLFHLKPALWKQRPWQVQQKTGLRVRNLEEIRPIRAEMQCEEQMVQQQKLQKHLALRHSMVPWLCLGAKLPGG